MKKRNIAFVIIMSIITLGVYDLYWLIDTRREMIQKGLPIPSVWWAVLAPFLGALVAAVAVGFLPSGNSKIFVITIVTLLVLIALGIWIYWLVKYCRAVEKVTNGDLSFGFTLSMALLLTLFDVWFIWVPIVQYNFNKISEPETHPSAPENS